PARVPRTAHRQKGQGGHVGTARVRETAVIGGVEISNPDKVWWPDDGITKGDIARFYHEISASLIPWMRDRPLTAERCPDGMLGGCFYRKNFPEGNIPAAAPRLRLRAESTGKDVNYLVGGTLDALLGLVRVGCIAMHVMNSRVGTMHEADWLAFDLDPGSGEFADAARAGAALHALLDEQKLASFPKTSGSRGLHVFRPSGGMTFARHPGVEKRARRAGRPAGHQVDVGEKLPQRGLSHWFSQFASRTANATGSHWAFLAMVVFIVTWAVTGPL